MFPDPRADVHADGGLVLQRDGPIATLVLNRPERRNALNLAMWHALPALLAQVAAAPDVRVLVLRGAGGHFASGADISEFPEVFGGHAPATAYTAAIEAATDALEAMPMPVLAGIDGYCIGAGLAVALACDIRICADDASFAAPPARLGLLYSVSDTQRLVRTVGRGPATDMLLGATSLSAMQALTAGLVTEVHPADTLDAAVAARATALSGLSGWSQRHTKAILARVDAGETRDSDLTRSWFAAAGDNPDFQAALARFLAPHR
jgi:enoyl-CoA hydratase/carnithine racemase